MVSPTGHRVRAALVVFAFAISYVLLVVLRTRLGDSLLLNTLMTTLAYLAAIPFYFVSMRSAAVGLVLPFGLVAATAVITLGLLVPSESTAQALFDITRILTTGYLVGWLVSRRKGLTLAYVIGTIWILIMSIAQYWNLWPMMIALLQDQADQVMNLLETSPAFKAASADMQDELRASIQSSLAMAARLSPGSVVMSTIVPMSIAFLWFLYRGVQDGKLAMWKIRFTSWKTPWQLSSVLIVAIAARLLGGETIQIIADNLIMIMAIYYCVTGLSLIDWFLKLINLPFWFRVLFYVFLTVTGLLGFAVVSIIGFVDSFRDFRQKTMFDLNLKKE